MPITIQVPSVCPRLKEKTSLVAQELIRIPAASDRFVTKDGIDGASEDRSHFRLFCRHRRYKIQDPLKNPESLLEKTAGRAAIG